MTLLVGTLRGKMSFNRLEFLIKHMFQSKIRPILNERHLKSLSFIYKNGSNCDIIFLVPKPVAKCSISGLMHQEQILCDINLFLTLHILYLLVV